MKKAKNDIIQKENEPPCTSTPDECSINVSINGLTISLSPHSNPPKAEDLFHAMFFEEELPKAPTHYKQQRWNKRRIQKRWNWKRGKEREIYEKRAEYLKNKWIEMKKDYKANNNTKLSQEFLFKNNNLKMDLNDDNDDSVHESDDENEELDFSALSTIDPNKNENKSNSAKNIKKKGKKKYIRRRNDKEKDNLLFGGTQSNTKKTKPKKSKKKKSMKLSEFITKTNNRITTTIKNNNNNIKNIESLDDIQRQQIKDFEAFNRKKRNEIHKKKIKNLDSINSSLSDYMKIRNYDDIAFRSKTINEIYCGSSVFSCIPCCVEPSNTLLISAVFIDKLLQPHSSLSSLSGLFELKKRLKKEFNNQIIEVLPIFERAYIDKVCAELLLIQFQDDITDDNDNINCAMLMKEEIENKNKNNNLRIDFVEKWFAKSYILQHSHLWSDIALTSNITVYDNNDQYIQNVNTKAKHCRCSFKRIIYFPPFYRDSQHDAKCILHCCCCMFYHDDNNECDRISNGDAVLWHGTKCIVQDCTVQNCRIEILQSKYVVALSSLQTIKQSSKRKEEKQIRDDLSFVKYTKKFWNITNLS